jgi:hypothetical protein
MSKTNEKVCSRLPSSRCASSGKLNVPVVPYNMEMPNSNNPDKADDIMNFIAASDERLCSGQNWKVQQAEW